MTKDKNNNYSQEPFYEEGFYLNNTQAANSARDNEVIDFVESELSKEDKKAFLQKMKLDPTLQDKLDQYMNIKYQLKSKPDIYADWDQLHSKIMMKVDSQIFQKKK
jgi:hypothetical protein